MNRPRAFNGPYVGSGLDEIAFPLGGMGAGMICLEGSGALSRFSLHHRPDLVTEHKVFSAIAVRGLRASARVLAGPVPAWKLRPRFSGEWGSTSSACWGLPRFREATFEARFPFARIALADEAMPLEVQLTGWSPFSPGHADDASLPVAGLEYRFTNRTEAPVEAVFSFNAENFMAAPPDPADFNASTADRVVATTGGFVVQSAGTDSCPWAEGCFAAWVTEPHVNVNHAWFQGGWIDHLQMIWNDIASFKCDPRNPLADRASPGASLFVPFALAPHESRTIVLHLAWYVPRSNLFRPIYRFADGKMLRITEAGKTYRPWYAGRFDSIGDVKSYWQSNYRRLRSSAEQFSDAFYDSTLPAEVIEAVAANLSTLKSPTVLRQLDGTLWGWEGSYDEIGSWYGTSTHVWNYAQAIPHLFPDLERGLRETELGPDLGSDGFQAVRSALPIRPVGDSKEDGLPACADGQLGGIIKVYRDWRISGDTSWLLRLWPSVCASLDYCIRTWDPAHRGAIEEPHFNTYDIAFWGADSLCTSLYLGALKAASLMGEALGEDVARYADLLIRCRQYLEAELFNGEYFFQRTSWENLRAPFPPLNDEVVTPLLQKADMSKLMQKEGPPYQYGEGCLADGVLGAWLCMVSGVGEVLDSRKTESHLLAVYRHNFKPSLRENVNLLRSVLACGEDAGTLLCTWPRGGRPTLPFMNAHEVWSGIEYQVASHLIAIGRVDEGVDIVRACRRRYDGRFRNPFAEAEAGHWYARAMSSYALLQSFSGARFDAVDKVLYLAPAIKGDFRCFLSTATGFGTVGVREGAPFVEVICGQIPYTRIDYTPLASVSRDPA